jgi:hypothetical protein
MSAPLAWDLRKGGYSHSGKWTRSDPKALFEAGLPGDAR